jgi:hypothetical protein
MIQSKTANFDFSGRSVEVTCPPPQWTVRLGDQISESRRLDEALEAVLGRSGALVMLTVPSRSSSGPIPSQARSDSGQGTAVRCPVYQ